MATAHEKPATKSSLIENFKYRPEVDGLRALAVIPVVLFHAGLGFPGGYVGVDVFFVISGYLITSLIIKDLERGSFSMLDFWERRARRILPAGTAMVVATLLLGSLAMTPESSDALGMSASWQSLFGANIYFERTIDYFSGAAEEMPLLHTWSLAVEEQFYFVVPVLLYLIFLRSVLPARSTLLGLIFAAMIASFVFAAFQVRNDASAAFYLLPSRAWELLMGSFIALAPAATGKKVFRNLLAWTGVACIAIPYFAYDHHTQFPGPMALTPCLGAALYIWASRDLGEAGSRPLIIRCFASKPIVFIGLISYSLYLWHWPITALANYWSLLGSDLTVGVGIVIASILLAILSWRFIETPFRIRRLGASRKSMFAYSLLFIGGAFILSGVVRKTDGFAGLMAGDLSQLSREAEDRKKRRSYTQETSLQDALNQNFLSYGTKEASDVNLFVWGDSHARSVLPCIKELATNNASKTKAAWHGATPPAVRYANTSPWSVGKDSPEYNKAIFDYVASQSIPHTLLIGYWSGYTSGERGDTFLKDLNLLVERLSEAGTQVWFLREWPAFEIDIPKRVYAQQALSLELGDADSELERHQVRVARMEQHIAALEQAGAKILDPLPTFTPPDGEGFLIQSEAYPIYYDKHHLSVEGSKLLAPLLQHLFIQPTQENPPPSEP